MNENDIQRQWQSLETSLSRSLAIQHELIRRSVVEPTRRRMRGLMFWPALDIAACVAGMLLFGSMLAAYAGQARLAFPIVVCMLGIVALAISSVRQLERVASIDWSGSVAQIQASLGALRAMRISQFKWVILLSPLIGFCAFLTTAHGVLDRVSGGRADFYESIDSGWLIGNYVLGILFVPLAFVAARAAGDRWGSHRWWRVLLDDLSGKSLARATEDIRRWAELAAETSSSPPAAS